MRIATEVLVEKYKDHLFAAAFNVCKNAADADDVVQDTFLQYHTTNRQFENEQHIRAWLIRVAINKAKNINLSLNPYPQEKQSHRHQKQINTQVIGYHWIPF